MAIARYNDSRQADSRALDESQTQLYAQQIRTDITEEGGLADAYGGDADPADLADLNAAKDSLAQALHALKESPGLDPEEAGFVGTIAAGQRRLDSIFQNQLEPVAGTPDFDEGVFPFDEQVERMQGQIDAFNRASAEQAAEAASDSDSTASGARTAVLLAALFAAICAIGVAVHARRVIERLFASIDEKVAHIEEQRRISMGSRPRRRRCASRRTRCSPP